MNNYLFTIALQFVTVWTNPITGDRTYIDWCRKTGDCEATIAHVTNGISEAARKHDIQESLLYALVATESRLNPRAKSKIGAWGLTQLHPQGKMSVAAKKYCRGKTKKECDIANLDIGTFYFAQLIRTCGSPQQAIYAWRTGRCGKGPYSDHTAKLWKETEKRINSMKASQEALASLPLEQAQRSLLCSQETQQLENQTGAR